MTEDTSDIRTRFTAEDVEFVGDETPDGHVNADEFEAGPTTDLPDVPVTDGAPVVVADAA